MADANNGDTQGAASSSSSRNADALDGASTTTTTSGPAPKRGRRGGRAPSNPAAAHGSAQYRIFRVMEEGRWVPAANAAVKGSRVDSLVHRYGREVGFKKVNPYDDEKQIEAARKKLEELQKKSNAAEAAAAAAAGVGNVQLSENEDEEEKEEEGKEDDDTTDDERLQNISDDVARALSFVPEIVMPKAWKALWSLKISDKNKRRLWARFLVQFALVARSSDVAGEYFPLMENVSFPPDAKHYLEDGNPMYIDVVFTKWKGRPLSQGSTPYTIRLWHNPQDLRFCPVHWLTRHWADLGRTTGPMFDNISARTYQRHLKKLFSSIQYKLADGSFDVVDCSSRSIRRAAAQWAARCGASLADVRNVGRWVALKHLTYIAEGVEMRSNALRANNDVDPVLSVWEFNVETVVSSIASTNEVLIALGNSRR